MSTRHEVHQGAERRDHVNFRTRLIVLEEFDNTVGRARHQQSLIIFIDESRACYGAPIWITIGEFTERLLSFPVPNTDVVISTWLTYYESTLPNCIAIVRNC